MNEVGRINPTAREAYLIEGEGVGGNADVMAFLKNLAGIKVDRGTKYLDVGFGAGADIVDAINMGADLVCGVDLAPASLAYVYDRLNKDNPKLDLRLLDCCDEPLPWDDDTFDIAVCTEAIEHMPNPYRMVSEVKRVLKHGGTFLIAFPDPADNLGYGGGQHAHVMPGFLEKPSFRRFMMQLYFHNGVHKQNGSSAWYTYENYKGPGIMDVFHMIAGNFTEEQLYGMMNNTVRDLP